MRPPPAAGTLRMYALTSDAMVTAYPFRLLVGGAA